MASLTMSAEDYIENVARVEAIILRDSAGLVAGLESVQERGGKDRKENSFKHDGYSFSVRHDAGRFASPQRPPLFSPFDRGDGRRVEPRTSE
jgi:hypothetical protein